MKFWHPEAAIVLRNIAGLNQAEVAAAISVDASYVSRLETDGERNPSDDVINGYAQAVGQAPETLYVELTAEQHLAGLIDALGPSRDSLDLGIEILIRVHDLRGRR